MCKSTYFDMGPPGGMQAPNDGQLPSQGKGK